MKKVLVLVLILLLVSLSTYSETLKVVMHDSPPFVMMDVNDSYTGLVVDVWEKMANDLNIEYEYVQYDGSINSMIDSVSRGVYDVALGSITITSDRMDKADISHPYYDTDVSIAANVKQSGMMNFLSNIFSLMLLKYVLSLIVLLFAQ